MAYHHHPHSCPHQQQMVIYIKESWRNRQARKLFQGKQQFENVFTLVFKVLVLLVIASFGPVVIGDSSFKTILSLLQAGSHHNDSTHRVKVQRMVASHVELVLWQVNQLQQLNYGQVCDSVQSERARHDLTDLVAKVTQSPSEQLFTDIDTKQGVILKSGKFMCDYSRGLSCDAESLKCNCYTGHRHTDIVYEPVRESGSCKLDEMSACYSPSYLVSRGAVVIHCINGAKCVGDVSGRRCVSPVMAENCHCQKPCPDGSFTNLNDELKKCIAKLSEISVLQFNDSCTSRDQTERDDVVKVLDTSGSERAGPIIRGIKRLLSSNRSLCSPQDQLVCHPELKQCVCGPEKDGILYERVNDSCLWAKGSRCFPEDIYANVTGSNGSCVDMTKCLMEGQNVACDPNYEEPQCYCQDPADLESSGMVALVLVLLVVVLGAGGIIAFLVHANMISCPIGGSPANV